MRKLVRTLLVMLWMVIPVIALAGPPQDANAVIDRWSAAYNTNDPDAVVRRGFRCCPVRPSAVDRSSWGG